MSFHSKRNNKIMIISNNKMINNNNKNYQKWKVKFLIMLDLNLNNYPEIIVHLLDLIINLKNIILDRIYLIHTMK